MSSKENRITHLQVKTNMAIYYMAFKNPYLDRIFPYSDWVFPRFFLSRIFACFKLKIMKNVQKVQKCTQEKHSAGESYYPDEDTEASDGYNKRLSTSLVRSVP